jgi:hypothetical protein
MNSEAHWVPGECYNCQETQIEFNHKEIKGVSNKYKLTSIRNKVSDSKKKIFKANKPKETGNQEKPDN